MNRILLLMICLLLSSCGFHFRDSPTTVSPELKSIYIQDEADARTGLYFSLRQNLQALGITLVDKPTKAPVSLVILDDGFGQSITAMGTAQQINSQILTYTVTLVLRDANGKNITQPVTLNTASHAWQNSNQILGDTTALPDLRKKLTTDMTQKILAYLSATDTQKAIHATHI
ncbi:MAG TPA: LPS assembly lipoprotein LptE [Gammaproteobacteria bacterium]|nr:LPS assembly lipoprotein LptE [Gammaproteobacteria bacterium]